MTRVAIIQARTGSTRFPGKVMMDLAGRPMLAQIIGRLQRCHHIDGIVVATTDRAEDDVVAALAAESEADVFRGSEHDVLGRYLGAARAAAADIVVRVTADCPLIDPVTVDRVIEALTDAPAVDYASNVIERSYPRGLDVEVFFRGTLERVAQRAVSAPAREHVTYYILRERPDLFTARSVVDAEDNSDLRWTVDEPDDLDMVRRVYGDLGVASRDVAYRDLLAHVRAHPEIQAINAGVQQKVSP